MNIEAFLASTSLVALAEIGDKTQLLSFVLAARLRKPIPIIAGIFVAPVLNHALAASVGVWLAQLIAPQWVTLGHRCGIHYFWFMGFASRCVG